MTTDKNTADAFANSWNNLPGGSVYTFDQFTDWLAPINSCHVEGKSVLELGCGNASLLMHFSNWNPGSLRGVDLGDSVLSAKQNMQATGLTNWEIVKDDLTVYRGNACDIVYCIGVLHHLKSPESGFHSVIKNTKPGGRFHCWVYAREGNGVIVYIVDPIRKLASKLPWWFTKYFIATPLVIPYFLYAKFLSTFKNIGMFKKFPLFDYSVWIAKRGFLFFRHVAFDQLVTPHTVYIKKSSIEKWLKAYPEIKQESCYIIFRNGNSWKFGGSLHENITG